jgi:membrane protease subunit (stomatin/prohibitin family)
MKDSWLDDSMVDAKVVLRVVMTVVLKVERLVILLVDQLVGVSAVYWVERMEIRTESNLVESMAASSVNLMAGLLDKC